MSKTMDLMDIAAKLKTTYRFSESKGMPKESTAAHSWRVALMAMMLAENLHLKLDIHRAMKIALIHDLAEAVTGDLDYRLAVKNPLLKKKKEKQEKAAFKKIGSREIKALWEEYEYGRTEEGRYVKAVDKLETLLYLAELGHRYYDEPELIMSYADKAVSRFPKLLPALAEIKKRLRKEFRKIKAPCNHSFSER